LFAWLLLAFRLSSAAESQSRPAGNGLVLACLLMASAELVRLFAIAGFGPVVGIAPGVQLAAAVVLAIAAGRELRAAYQSTEEGTADLVRTISGLQRQVAALEVADRERLHDARSAVVGVLGASELLGRVPADEEVTRLRSLITQELRRVQSVLDTRGVEPITDFDLDDALAAVVLSHQLHGHPVIAALDGVTVSGRPRATATVLDNLLRNASVHAPGARVVVRVGTFGRFAAVVVEDDGPGISDADRLRLLGPGVRGAQAGGPGEGLGLHSAVTTMRAQGGSLRLDRREGGGTRVTFTLPLAGGSTISVDRALARGAGAA
jgi:signal transduction histidine kinase